MDTKKIFLSYSRDDEKFVLNLVDYLKQNNFNIWIDQIDIPGGHHWDNTIEKALNNTCILVLILSPSSAKSDNVKDEVAHALVNKIPIIPIRYINIDEDKIPFRWNRLQSLDLNEKNFDKNIGVLISNIRDLKACKSVDINNTTPNIQKPSNIKWFVFIAIVILLYIIIYQRNNIQYSPSIYSEQVIQNKEEIKLKKKIYETENNQVVKNVIVKTKPQIETKKKIQSEVKKKSIHVVKPNQPKKKIVSISEPIEIYEDPKIEKNLLKMITEPEINCDGSYKEECERLKQDDSKYIVISVHINSEDMRDTADNQAYLISKNLEEKGIDESRINYGVKFGDSEKNITFEYRKITD